MQNINEQIESFKQSLYANNTIQVLSFTKNEVPAEIDDYGGIFDDGLTATQILSFYKKFNGFACKWQAIDKNRDVSGSVAFLRMEQMLPIQNKNFEPFEVPTEFCPIDVFNPEALVGFYKGSNKNSKLYLYDHTHDPKNLGVDIFGYFELMLYAKAYRYWQYLILEILHNEVATIGEQLRSNISGLFSDFTMVGFTELYTKHQIVK
ncbi:MAG: hypothetical protein MUF24_10320 [Chitinophagaceae bacterium]|nr:hypothetical protein [Chitinophagaceae bacterium]